MPYLQPASLLSPPEFPTYLQAWKDPILTSYTRGFSGFPKMGSVVGSWVILTVLHSLSLCSLVLSAFLAWLLSHDFPLDSCTRFSHLGFTVTLFYTCLHLGSPDVLVCATWCLIFIPDELLLKIIYDILSLLPSAAPRPPFWVYTLLKDEYAFGIFIFIVGFQSSLHA